MADEMPTSVELQNAFGPAGPGAVTRSTSAQMRDQERTGRLGRQAQVVDNVRVDHWEECIFEGGTDPLVSEDFIDFAQVKFIAKPSFSTGSQRLPEEDPEATVYPALAVVSEWRQDDHGYYTGAKLLFFAIGYPSSGYKIMVSCSWFGPAIRIGG